MIYLFLGEGYSRKKLVGAWIDKFKRDYSENNIFRIKNIYDFDLGFYEQNMMSMGLFSSKNLFIIDSYPISSINGSRNDKRYSTSDYDIDLDKYTDFFVEIMPKLGDDNILLFNLQTIDKRSKLYKAIKKYGVIKDLEIKDKNSLIKLLQDKYRDKISIGAINTMIDRKGIDFSAIEDEIDKLLITIDYVDVSDLVDISVDVEESIFNIINDILNLNIKKVLFDIEFLYAQIDPYLFYNSLISNLRLYLYIFTLRSRGVSDGDIINTLNLGNRGFLVSKNYKISLDKFRNFYYNVVSIDKKMKSSELYSQEPLLYETQKYIAYLKTK